MTVLGSPDRGRKKVEAKWLARTLKRKWELLPSAEVGNKKNQFLERTSSWIDGANPVPRLRVKERNRILDKKSPCLQARDIYLKTSPAHKRKNILHRNPSEKDKWTIRLFLPISNYIFSLSQSEERLKKEKKKDIYVYVLSVKNIADALQ